MNLSSIQRQEASPNAFRIEYTKEHARFQAHLLTFSLCKFWRFFLREKSCYALPNISIVFYLTIVKCTNLVRLQFTVSDQLNKTCYVRIAYFKKVVSIGAILAIRSFSISIKPIKIPFFNQVSPSVHNGYKKEGMSPEVFYYEYIITPAQPLVSCAG